MLSRLLPLLLVSLVTSPLLAQSPPQSSKPEVSIQGLLTASNSWRNGLPNWKTMNANRGHLRPRTQVRRPGPTANRPRLAPLWRQLLTPSTWEAQPKSGRQKSITRHCRSEVSAMWISRRRIRRGP